MFPHRSCPRVDLYLNLYRLYRLVAKVREEKRYSVRFDLGVQIKERRTHIIFITQACIISTPLVFFIFCH